MDYLEMNQKLKNSLTPERYEHSKGVESVAVHLAEIWGADVEKARIAGLLHDLAKNMDKEKSKKLINQITDDKNILDVPALWHAPIGAHLLEKEYEITDRDIYDAVYYHATGRPEMSLLTQIIYVADLIEPGRDRYLDWAADCRVLADEDLEKATLFVTDKTIESLIKRGMKINPVVVEIHNRALKKVNDDF